MQFICHYRCEACESNWQLQTNRPALNYCPVCHHAHEPIKIQWILGNEKFDLSRVHEIRGKYVDN